MGDKEKQIANKLKNKVAIITGGTTGIGFATAKRFIDEGAKVIVTGTNPSTVEAASRELGTQAEVLRSDASSGKDVKALVDKVVQEHGGIDVLFLNAAIGSFSPWEQFIEEEFDRQFAVNVKGPWLAIKHAIPHLKEGASVIAATSVANKKSSPGTSVYAATKAALLQLVRSAAGELSPRGIRVNAVCPGLFNTAAWDKLGMSPDEKKQLFEDMVSGIALGRMGKLDEVVNVVTFLASDDSSYVQGQEIVVDGGMTLECGPMQKLWGEGL